MKKRLLLLIPLIILAGCFHDEAPTAFDDVVIEIVDENLAPSDGCCETSGGCAEGVGVTKEFCEDELNGTHSVGTTCQENNKCE